MLWYFFNYICILVVTYNFSFFFQIEVYKSLKTIMEERDVTAFCTMRDEFCKTLLENPGTQEFGEYFINY